MSKERKINIAMFIFAQFIAVGLALLCDTLGIIVTI